MPASNYPHALDTDTELLRRTGSDAIVPADHNNLVDAIEQLEATVGTVGDGTEQGGAQTFLGALADYAGFLSTAQINVRHPWAPFVSASEFYGRTGATPIAWTINPLVVVSYVNPRGLARFSPSLNVGQLLASAPVIGTDPMYVMVRLAILGTNLNPKLAFGWSVNGLGTDIDGFHVIGAGTTGPLGYGLLGGVEASHDWYFQGPEGYATVVLRMISGNVSILATPDGLLWGDWFPLGTKTGTYTTFCIYQEGAATYLYKWWLDLISFGTSLPAGWSGG